jgi:hypothetical protein
VRAGQRRWILVAGLATLLAFGSCSSGTSAGSAASTVTTPDAPSSSVVSSGKAEFLKQASEICVEVGVAHSAFDSDIKSRPISGPSVAQLLNGDADFSTTVLQRLKALPQPPEDQIELPTIYAVLEDYIDATRDAATAAAANDEGAYQALIGRASDAGKDSDSYFVAYGLPECGAHRSTGETA